MTVSDHYPATLPSIGWGGGDTTTTDQTTTMDPTEEKIKQYIKAIHHLCQNDNDGKRYLREQLASYNLLPDHQQEKIDELQEEVAGLNNQIKDLKSELADFANGLATSADQD